jgi:hypothetical protein
MSTSLLVAKERQPGSPFGLRQKQAKEAQKNTEQMRHSCTIFFLRDESYRASFE